MSNLNTEVIHVTLILPIHVILTIKFPPAYRHGVALLYLKQADYGLKAAIEVYRDDERWEKEHPLEMSVVGKGKRKARYDLRKRGLQGGDYR
jgi:hypothetical protein